MREWFPLEVVRFALFDCSAEEYTRIIGRGFKWIVLVRSDTTLCF